MAVVEALAALSAAEDRLAQLAHILTAPERRGQLAWVQFGPGESRYLVCSLEPLPVPARG